jgi:hypothetical protein
MHSRVSAKRRVNIARSPGDRLAEQSATCRPDVVRVAWIVRVRITQLVQREWQTNETFVL